ncbi:hydrogenase formation protein HypD [Rubeoparvulum massiliense]|uniref:hydrogenase formation protein HypD n=1 Tax=Rubeoparvulum massiliense TaxID=1631346 RepID=UPI00065E1403|nr:hydrogenase formation protein HypD [Rubeoparvulum massiliense]
MRPMIHELLDDELSQQLMEKVKAEARRFTAKHGRRPAIMEVCGSHTNSLAEAGIRQGLREDVRLIAGPGCPVCVTDQRDIDAMIQLGQEDVILCTFGDMIRVPGSRGSLLDAKTAGHDIRVIYNPVDAITIAKENPDREVVLLGIGFETTVPAFSVAMEVAEREGVKNFSIWATYKLVIPILKWLLAQEDVQVDGFILPGHASIVLGLNRYRFLAEEYHVPGVITGFDAVEMLGGIHRLIQLLADGEPAVENAYRMVVRDEGNTTAYALIEKYFEPADEAWRGMGVVPGSGLRIRPEYVQYDARTKFAHMEVPKTRKTACRCGEILKGTIEPPECPLFAKACTPLRPIGPCMVSSEGTCQTHYKYMREVE